MPSLAWYLFFQFLCLHHFAKSCMPVLLQIVHDPLVKTFQKAAVQALKVSAIYDNFVLRV